MLNFFSKLCFHHGWLKLSNWWWSDYWKIHLRIKNLKVQIFIMTPWQISLLDSYHHLPDRKCNYPLGNIFFLKIYPPVERRGEKTMSFINKKRFQKFLGLAACYGFHIYVFVMLLFLCSIFIINFRRNIIINLLIYLKLTANSSQL